VAVTTKWNGNPNSRIRIKIESDIAFALAVVACGLTAAAWLRILVPVILAKFSQG